MSDIFLRHILGQERAKKLLLSSYQNNKVSHAFLFKGPYGVGKKRMALTFAALLNCLDLQNNDCCGQCPSCRKLKSGNHPDYFVVEPEGALLKINQIRQLKKDLSFPPFEAKSRVVLIADIHETMRRKEVANSLLKTLEEPPANTVFVLTADETQGVLQTILSRCQVVPFYPLPVHLVSQELCAQGDDPQVAKTLAAISEGSLGRARNIAHQNLLEFRRHVVESLSALNRKSPGAIETIIGLAEKTAKLKADLFVFMELLKLWIRDLMIISAQGEEAELINHDLNHTFPSTKDSWNLSELSDKIDKINRAIKQINHNCNKSFVCEVLYWELVRQA